MNIDDIQRLHDELIKRKIQPLTLAGGRKVYMLRADGGVNRLIDAKVPWWWAWEARWCLVKAHVLGFFHRLRMGTVGDGKPFHYDVYLRNTQTGEFKVYRENYGWNTPTDGVFQWEQGNYSCDCNRSLFMYDHEESKELPCSGKENVIVVDKLVVVETGEVVARNI